MRLWGIPKAVKTDNGVAYRSGRFSEMCRFFNIDQHFAKVKLARAKPVESMHNILDNLLKTSIGYTGNKYQEMPQDTKDRLAFCMKKQADVKKYEKFVKENEGFQFTLGNPEARLKSSKRRFMHITELEELLNAKLAEYHERVHGGLKSDKLGRKVYNVNCTDPQINQMGESLNSPNGRYKYHVAQGFKPVFADPAIIGLYATNWDLRVVQTKTGISFGNAEYYHPKLSTIAGKLVQIRYAHTDPSEIYVFTSDELQKIKRDRNSVTEEISRSLDRGFVCIAEKQMLIDYNDKPAFTSQLILQREEEQRLRESIGKGKRIQPPQFPAAGESNIIQLTGAESTVDEIRREEARITENRTPKKNKYKDIDLF